MVKICGECEEPNPVCEQCNKLIVRGLAMIVEDEHIHFCSKKCVMAYSLECVEKITWCEAAEDGV